MRTDKLPVIQIISRVFSSARNNKFSLIRLGLPVIIIGLFSTTYYELYEPEKILFGDFSLSGLIITALNTAAYAMAIIGIHQVFLLPPGIVANTSTFRWTPRESKWLGWSLAMIFWVILLSLVPGCVMVPIFKESGDVLAQSTGAVEVTGWLFGLFIGYFMTRWSLIFPSIATDGNLKGLGDSWELSKGNVLSLFLLIGVIPMVTSWAISFLPADRSIFLSIAVQILGWVVATLEIGLLSHSYAFLTKGNNEQEKTAAVIM